MKCSISCMQVERLKAQVKGQLTPLSDLAEFSDHKEIAKVSAQEVLVWGLAHNMKLKSIEGQWYSIGGMQEVLLVKVGSIDWYFIHGKTF